MIILILFVLNVIGYVLSITWKAHGQSFCDKNDYEVLSINIIRTKFSGAAHLRCSNATFYDLLDVRYLDSTTLPR